MNETMTPLPTEDFAVALIHDVFADHGGDERLRRVLLEAKTRGARLAVLPELPLNRWSPATRISVDSDAEERGGPRALRLSAAAREAGLAVLGGVIRKDARTGGRYNTALLLDASGACVAEYEKLHLPEEEGFWETSHYLPGRTPPRVNGALGPSLGVQICSDANRPVGAHLLAAQGVEIILAPRATSPSSYAQWLLAFRAMALTSAAWVVSVNRPGPELGAPIGGASLVVDPWGSLMLETADPLTMFTLDVAKSRQARTEYPGYLPFPAFVYAAAWEEIARAHAGR